MAAASTDLLQSVGIATATTLDAPGYTIGGTSLTVASTANMPTDTGITVAVDVVDSDGVQVAGSYNEYVGVVTSGTAITSLSHQNGTDRNYSAGATTRVYLPVSAERENRIVEWGLTHADQDGTLKAGAVDVSAVITDGIVTRPKLASGLAGEFTSGWVTGDIPAPNTVTNNGNRSYDLVFNSTDLTDTVSEGMRLRTTRTVSAPTQCTDLESGSSQYWTKTTPTGLTQTDDITTMQWVKLESYGTMYLISQTTTPGTNGWRVYLDTAGAINLNVQGRYSNTYQSVPLNKWVHIAVSVDASANSALFYLDGVLIPSTTLSGAGTWTSSGNLRIGADPTPANYFDGKIAQVALFSSVLSASTIRSYSSQTLAGTESTCIGLWKFDGDGNDSNANANNLTASGSAVATNVDTPFGNYLGGTLDYAIITKTAFSTNTTLTVQVPEGCTIPTSGGVSAVSYSTQGVPYGFPRAEGRWGIKTILNGAFTQSSPVQNTWYNLTTTSGTAGGSVISVPVGNWKLGYEANTSFVGTTNTICLTTLSTAAATESDIDMTARVGNAGATTTLDFTKREKPYAVTATATYYLNIKTDQSALSSMNINSTSVIYAEPAYL